MVRWITLLVEGFAGPPTQDELLDGSRTYDDRDIPVLADEDYAVWTEVAAMYLPALLQVTPELVVLAGGETDYFDGSCDSARPRRSQGFELASRACAPDDRRRGYTSGASRIPHMKPATPRLTRPKNPCSSATQSLDGALSGALLVPMLGALALIRRRDAAP